MQAGEPAALMSRYAASLVHCPLPTSHCKHLPDLEVQLCHDQIVGVDQSLHVVRLLPAVLPELAELPELPELAVAPCICLHVRMEITLLHLPTSCICLRFISSSVCDSTAYID